jgi:hypothetical protein
MCPYNSISAGDGRCVCVELKKREALGTVYKNGPLTHLIDADYNLCHSLSNDKYLECMKLALRDE